MYEIEPQLFDEPPTATFPWQLRGIYISCNTLWMEKDVIKAQWHYTLAGHTTSLSVFYFLHQDWNCLLSQGKGFWQVIENTGIIFILIWFDSCTNVSPRHAIRVSAHSTPSAVSFSPFFELWNIPLKYDLNSKEPASHAIRHLVGTTTLMSNSICLRSFGASFSLRRAPSCLCNPCEWSLGEQTSLRHLKQIMSDVKTHYGM